MKKVNKRILTEYIPLMLTGVLIIVFGIIYKQSFIKLLPNLISLFVMLFNSRASRIGFLLGGLNCLLYTVVYAITSLWGNVISSVIGALFAFLSYARWKKRAYGQSTVIKKMKPLHRTFFIIVFIAAWFALSWGLSLGGGTQPFLDAYSGVSGLLIPILTMFAYIEETPFYTLGTFLSLVMWLMIAAAEPNEITFVIFSIYSCYMAVKRAITWVKLYREQQREIAQNNGVLIMGEHADN